MRIIFAALLCDFLIKTHAIGKYFKLNFGKSFEFIIIYIYIKQLYHVLF